MPYFPPVLLASGSQAGATTSLQAFTSGIIAGIVRPASDSTTALQFQNAAGNSTVMTMDTTNRRVGINQLVPGHTLHVYDGFAADGFAHFGTKFETVVSAASPATTYSYGVYCQSFTLSSVAITGDIVGGYFRANQFAGSGGSITRLIGGLFEASGGDASAGDMIAGSFEVGSGIATRKIGVNVPDVVGGTSNYAIYSNAGLVRFGDRTLMPAGTTASAPLNIPHGVAPTSPIDGDEWSTTAGRYFHINGVTVGPINKQAAYTQTYSTADRTLSSYTSDPESSAYSAGITGTVGTDPVAFSVPVASEANLNALRTAYENLRSFTEDLAGVVNSLVDDLQTMGLAG
jgi:hypothetical protein